MKVKLYLPLFLAVLLGCQPKENVKTYIPRALTANENFIQSEKSKNALTIEYDSTGTEAQAQKIFSVKLKDTTVQIQTGSSKATNKFSFAEFVNTEKTCILVQSADKSGLVAPFYLIYLNDNKLDVISVYKESHGAQDVRFTKGLTKIGRSGYVINNDFVITTVLTKVYPIKRQNPAERIQGLYFVTSPDKHTLVFLVGSSLYEVNYLTNEVFTQPLTKIPKEPKAIFKWIEDHYSWQASGKDTYFLKANADDNRIIDISQFKK